LWKPSKQVQRQLFRQEVLRVILLDARFRQISIVEISKGTINESLAHPRETFRPVILHGATLLCLCTITLLSECRLMFIRSNATPLFVRVANVFCAVRGAGVE
jgi:RadC-like JAB domain